MTRYYKKYEKNSGFLLSIYRDSIPTLITIGSNDIIILPISKYSVDVNLKSIKLYIKEIILSDDKVEKVEIERISIIGTFSRN